MSLRYIAGVFVAGRSLEEAGVELRLAGLAAKNTAAREGRIEPARPMLTLPDTASLGAIT